MRQIRPPKLVRLLCSKLTLKEQSQSTLRMTSQYKKVVPSYTFVRREVPVREDTYPEPSACEVGWPVPFLAAFISPVLALVPICCRMNSEQAFSQGIESGSNRRPSAQEACALTTMLPRSYHNIDHQNKRDINRSKLLNVEWPHYDLRLRTIM